MNDWDHAAQLADDYNWPDQARALREEHIVPRGFCREVGSAVALFKAPLIFPWLIPGNFRTQEEYDNSRASDAFHAKRLLELRVLLAKLNRRIET